MTLWQAVILGLVQGLTEFLPISSTAHLRIVPALCGWADPGAAFSAVIQIGTLLAVLAYFRHDILAIVVGMFSRGTEEMPDKLPSFPPRLGWMIVVGTIPVVVCGLLFQDAIETSLRSLYVISGSLIGLAVLLAIAERVARREKDLSRVGWGEALTVGCAQAVALIPGASRSGVTITGALFAGLTRETAARFSFLLSLPAVLAAGVYELVTTWDELVASRSDVLNLLVATVVSAVAGYVAIWLLLQYLKTHTTWLFIWYRLALGALLLVLLASGRLLP